MNLYNWEQVWWTDVEDEISTSETGKQGTCTICTVCIVRTVYSTCKWDRIIRTVVQYVLWCHRLDEWISRQHTFLLVAQEHQLQTDLHILSTPMYCTGRSNKLLAGNKGPYQVIGNRQSIYIIKDLVKGKQIKTHVHNLQPFIFSSQRSILSM